MMQDRFKFRAWNKRDKRMIYNAEDVYDGYLSGWCGVVGKENNNDGWISCFGEYLGRDEYVIMQSTGLKDKNGKLIYEGDMLKTDLKRPYNIVVFRNGMFMIECEHTTGIYYDLFCGVCDDLRKDIDSVSFEIIGNIYENKELLGEQK